MFLFPPKLIPSVAAASAVLLAFPAWALAEYHLSATGSDRQAALGNFRVKALQQHLRTVLSPEDLKGCAGIIRKKSFLTPLNSGSGSISRAWLPTGQIPTQWRLGATALSCVP